MPGLVRPAATSRAGDQRWIGSRHALNNAKTGTLLLSAFTAGTHYPNGYIPSGLPVDASDPANVRPWTNASAVNEVQTVTITGTPTGGTFTLTFDGETTAAIAYNASAAAVLSALEALPSIQAGDVTVGGGPGPGTPYTVTFVGGLAGRDIPQMTATSSLTGGTTPAVAVTTGTAGVGRTLRFVKDNHQVEAGITELQVALIWHGLIVEEFLPVAFTIPTDAAAGGFVFERSAI
jgi:hypothetical protein